MIRLQSGLQLLLLLSGDEVIRPVFGMPGAVQSTKHHLNLRAADLLISLSLQLPYIFIAVVCHHVKFAVDGRVFRRGHRRLSFMLCLC